LSNYFCTRVITGGYKDRKFRGNDRAVTVTVEVAAFGYHRQPLRLAAAAAFALLQASRGVSEECA
jgi:hypothetical protein